MAPNERVDEPWSSLDEFDVILLEAAGEPRAYREWAHRLAERTDGAGDTIRLAQAEAGIDEPGLYRITSLLRETTFVEELTA